MASRSGANARPHVSQFEQLNEDVTTALEPTLKSVEAAQKRLAGLEQAVKALQGNPSALPAVQKEYVLEALEALADIRDTAALDIRALAMWATDGRGKPLGISETAAASRIGASNSTITRWNKAE